MTNSKVPSGADDPQTWEHVPEIPFLEEIGAEVRDADDQFLSKGAAAFHSPQLAEFQPHDVAKMEMLRSRAKILFLTKAKNSLSISSISDDPQHPHGQRVRIRLVLS